MAHCLESSAIIEIHCHAAVIAFPLSPPYPLVPDGSVVALAFGGGYKRTESAALRDRTCLLPVGGVDTDYYRQAGILRLAEVYIGADSSVTKPLRCVSSRGPMIPTDYPPVPQISNPGRRSATVEWMRLKKRTCILPRDMRHLVLSALS